MNAEEREKLARRERNERWGRWTLAAVTLVIALWGAFTGTTAWNADRRVSVTMSSVLPNPPGSYVSYPEFSVANSSRHAVVMTGGDVIDDGHVVGKIVGWVVDAPNVNNSLKFVQFLDGGSALSPFPMSLQSGQTTLMAVRMSWIGSGVDGSEPNTAAAKFFEHVKGGRADGYLTKNEVEFRFDLENGDTVSSNVLLGGPAKPGHRAPIEIANGAAGTPIFRKKALVGFKFRLSPRVEDESPNGDRAAVMKMRAWHDGRVIASTTAPVSSRFWAKLPLDSSGLKGRVTWTGEIGGAVVSSGMVRTPCDPSRNDDGTESLGVVRCLVKSETAY